MVSCHYGQERELQHLDEVRLGNCRFVLLAHQEDEASHPSAVLSGEMALLTRTMVQLRRDKAVYLNPEEALESSASPARLAQGLKALLKVSTMVRATRGVKALAGNLMESVFEAVPAFEGAIVLFEPGLAEPLWTFGWTREAGAAGTVNVPGDLVSA